MSGKSATLETYDGSTPLDNAQHELLCHEYLVDFNGQKAGERARYKPKAARVQVSQLLTNPNIQARLAYLKNQRIQRAQKTGDDVLKELECIGFSRVNRIVSFNESGMEFVNNSDDIDDDDAAAIESVEVTEIVSKTDDGNDMLKTKVKLHPKIPALKELAKHHGVCRERVDLAFNGESLPEGIVINFVSSTPKGE